MSENDVNVSAVENNDGGNALTEDTVDTLGIHNVGSVKDGAEKRDAAAANRTATNLDRSADKEHDVTLLPAPKERQVKRLSTFAEKVDLELSIGSLDTTISNNEPSIMSSTAVSTKKRRTMTPINYAEALMPTFWQDSASVSENNIASSNIGMPSGGSSPLTPMVDRRVDNYNRNLSDEIAEAEDVIRVATIAAASEADTPRITSRSNDFSSDGKKTEEVSENNVIDDVAKRALDGTQHSGDSDESAHNFSSFPVPEDDYSMPIPPAPPSTPAAATASKDAYQPLPFQSGVARGKLSYSHLLGGEDGADGFSLPILSRKDDRIPHYEGALQPDLSGAATEPRRGNSFYNDGKPKPRQSTVSELDKWDVGDRYQLKRILGRGSYGEVAQAIDLQIAASINTDGLQDSPRRIRSTYVAVKKISNAFDQEVDAIRLFREMHILRRLRGHACVIQLIDVVQPRSSDLDLFNDLYLVFEYVDTDLYKLIMSPQYLTTEHIQTFLYQMLVGLKYIHSSSVIHRDLKPAILLNEDCTLKICDFGLARIVVNGKISQSIRGEGRPDSIDLVISGISRNSSVEEIYHNSVADDLPRPSLSRQLTKHVVTRWYRAPELILIQPYESAVDIWSLGCIFGELLSMQEGSVPNYQDRVPLFPGGSCYPLSGDQVSTDTKELQDQLSVIFSVIGMPSGEDLLSVGKTDKYISTLEKKPGRSLESLFPAADPAAINLLKSMLMFNPAKRCSAEEALDHEFLKPVRKKELEFCETQPLESPEFLEKNNIEIATIKEETYKEAMWYRQPL